ncbi:MAG: putative transport protein [Pseudohongiellaceae bacterium]|jgi:predicted transport protein
MECNLETLLGVRFLASEYSTGPKHGGRIDSLGIDENSCPVIIEYKRSTNENVINQGLYYLDWLMDHRAEFQLIVMEKLGKNAAECIDWSAPRLLCIAGGFTKYDDYAVQQMGRNIELIRYKRFGDELLLLELVNATSAPMPVKGSNGDDQQTVRYKTISDTLNTLKGPLRDLFEEVCAFLEALGDDVQQKTLKNYVAFKRIKNFACVEVFPSNSNVKVFAKVDPDGIELRKGFTRDVRKIGHYGTGDLEITLSSHGDLENAKSLLQRSYSES